MWIMMVSQSIAIEKCGCLLDEDKWNGLDSLPELEKKLSSDVIMTLNLHCSLSR